MQNKFRTKEQLLNELAELRQRIAEMEKSQSNLKEAEEKYHSLLEHAYDAIMIADFEGNLLEVNKKAEELLRLHKEKNCLAQTFRSFTQRKNLEGYCLLSEKWWKGKHTPYLIPKC